MENIKTINGNNKNKFRRKKSQSKKLKKKLIRRRKNKRSRIKRLAKVVLIACFILGSVKFAEIKIGNAYNVNKKQPIVNSNNIKKENNVGQAIGIENPLIYSLNDTNLQAKNNKNENYAEYTVCDVKAPKKRSKIQIYSALKEMAENNERIKKIYDEKEKYPITLLGSLVNNPEMTDFVIGYLNSDAKVAGKFNVDDLKEKNKLILQWDRRWGYESYGNSIIAVAGCAPTCLAMVISSLSENAPVTPYEIAKFSEDNNHYVKGVGTSWSLMTSAAIEYGLSVDEISSTETSMKKQLDDGHIIICTMSSGDFTAEGHFIVIYGYNENGFLVNDPNCVYRSKKVWNYRQLSSQINNLWAYSKK